MTASLLFLGLNPLFVSPRDDAINRKISLEKDKQTLKKLTLNIPKKKVNVKYYKKQSPKFKNDNMIPQPPLPHLVPIRKYTSSETSESGADDVDAFGSVNGTFDKETVYLILTKQRNEALEQAQSLQNALKKHQIDFNVKYDKFRKQLSQYKNTNDFLRDENIKLKQDLKRLKDRLHLFDDYPHLHHLELLLKKRNKKHITEKPQQQLPNFVKKDYKKKMLCFEPQTSGMKSNKQNKPPFIHSASSSCTEESLGSSSSLSAANAVHLSFPKKQKSCPLTHVRHLTTILEHKSVPLGLFLSNSTENVDIEDEWMDNSFVDIDADNNNNNNDNEDNKEALEYMQDDNQDMDGENDADTRSVSYMSNNTIILNDLSLELIDNDSRSNKNTKKLCIDVGEGIIMKPLLHIQNMSTVKELDLDDTIVSPIDISADYSFNIRV